MAEVKVTSMVNLRVTDVEWRLIMKSLALYAGLKISTRSDEKAAAAILNKQLLDQRILNLKEQLKVAEGAMDLANDVDPNPATAAVSRMAYSVGRQVGRREAEQEAEETTEDPIAEAR